MNLRAYILLKNRTGSKNYMNMKHLEAALEDAPIAG